MLQIEWNTATIIAEVFYCVIGAIFAATGFNALTNKDCEKASNYCHFLVLNCCYIYGWTIYSNLDYWFNRCSSCSYYLV